MKDWFKNWFNSPYYHILYQKRDEAEARFFIDNISWKLNIKKNSKILDLACGNGRHSVYFNEKGFNVVGADISPNNIQYANRFKNDKLSFYVHDMRKPFKTKLKGDDFFGLNYFDYIFNLFTSIGYFTNDKENYLAIKYASNSLKLNGFMIIDFMNSKKVLKNLVKDEMKNIDGIEFHIKRIFTPDGFIVKQIAIKDMGEKHLFKEQVKALELKDFEKYFAKCNLEIDNLFGDYSLSKFNEKQSSRLIMVCKKIN